MNWQSALEFSKFGHIRYFVQKTSFAIPLFLLSLSLLSPVCLGLSDDQEQDINIQADAAMIDDIKGVTIYSGNVTIDQGSLHISADEVKVIMSKREVLQIVASMKPDSEKLAHYEQVPDDNQPVSADARKITYFLQEKRLHLAGSAMLKQARDTFSGELLHYDLDRRVVDLKGGGKKSGGRVNIILTPD